MGLFFGFLSILLMSSQPVVSKIIIPTTGAAFPALINAVFAMIFFAIINFYQTKSIKIPMSKPSIVSGFANGIGLALMFLAIQSLHPAIFGFVGRLGVVFMMVLSTLFLKQRPDKIEVGLGLVAVLGALGSAFSDFSSASFFGLLFALGSTFCFSISNLSLKFAADRASNSQVLTCTNLIASILLFIYFILNSKNFVLPSDLKIWLLMLVTALLGNCIGFWCYMKSLKYLTFSRATLIRTTSPLFTAAISIPFFGFNFSTSQVASAFVLLLSILILTEYERRKKISGVD